MSNSPYAATMRNAQKILWGMAVIILLSSFIGDMQSISIPGELDNAVTTANKTAKLFSAVATALYSAAFPLFGAALLHRIDAMMEARA